MKAVPTTGMSIEPHVSAAQWTSPEKKSAIRMPLTARKEADLFVCLFVGKDENSGDLTLFRYKNDKKP